MIRIAVAMLSVLALTIVMIAAPPAHRAEWPPGAGWLATAQVNAPSTAERIALPQLPAGTGSPAAVVVRSGRVTRTAHGNAVGWNPEKRWRAWNRG